MEVFGLSKSISCERSEPIPSEALVQLRKPLRISHAGRIYCLSVTRRGRLILTAEVSEAESTRSS